MAKKLRHGISRPPWPAARVPAPGRLPLALAVGITWAINAVGGGTVVPALLLAAAATWVGWNRRRGLSVVLLVAALSAVVVLVAQLITQGVGAREHWSRPARPTHHRSWPALNSQRCSPGRRGSGGYVRGSTDGRSDVIELTKGQEFALAAEDGQPLSRLQLGLGWDKARTAGYLGTGAPDIDLDASAVEFAGGQLFDLAFYNNLQTRDGSLVHLGDNLTGRGEGDDERLALDLSRVYPRVDTIVFLVSSYHGHSLEWISNAYCRLVDNQDVELARFTLTGGVPQTGLVLAKLVRDGEGWKLRAIGEGIAVKIPTDSVEALRPFL